MWRGLESLFGRYVISNNVLSSREFIGKQRLFSREKVVPKSIAFEASFGFKGYIDLLFNYDKNTYQALRLSRDPKFPSMVYTSNIEGQFLKAYKVPLNYNDLDDKKKYAIELVASQENELTLKLDGKKILSVPESFNYNFIGLEINIFPRIYSPQITLKDGGVINADFNSPFNFLKFFTRNFFLLSALVLAFALLSYKNLYRAYVRWLVLVIGLGVTWYLFDYLEYSKRNFRWSFPDRAMILPEGSTSIIDYELYRYNFFRQWYEFIGGSTYSSLPETNDLFLDYPPWTSLGFCRNENCEKKMPELEFKTESTIRFMVLGGSLSEGLGVNQRDDNFHALIHKELVRRYEKKLTIESTFSSFDIFVNIGPQIAKSRDRVKMFKPDYIIFNVTTEFLKRPDVQSLLEEFTKQGIHLSILEHINENPNPKELDEFWAMDPRNLGDKGNPNVNVHFHYMNAYLHSEENRLTGNLWWDYSHLSTYGHYLLFEGFFPEFFSIIQNDRAKKKLFY
jgi:hypothetical protein